MSPYENTRSYHSDDAPTIPNGPGQSQSTAPIGGTAGGQPQTQIHIPWPETPASSPPRNRRPRRRLYRYGGIVLVICLIGVGIFVATHRQRTGSTAMIPPNVLTATVPASATVAATAAPTVATVTSCADLPNFAHAGATITNSTHFAITFPAHSVGISGDAESQGYQQRAITACTPDMTAASLTNALANQLTGAGWVAVTPSQSGPACEAGAAGCWQFTETPEIVTNGGHITKFVSLEQVQTQGNIVTYTLRLTIAPFAGGSGTFTNAKPDFSVDLAPTPDLHWNGGTQFALVQAALYAPLPGAFAAATFTQVENLPFTHNNGQPITLHEGEPVGLKSNGGHFAKFVITNAGNSTISFQYVTYSYGF